MLGCVSSARLVLQLGTQRACTGSRQLEIVSSHGSHCPNGSIHRLCSAVCRPVWSEPLKEQYGLDQTHLEIIASACNMGGYSSIIGQASSGAWCCCRCQAQALRVCRGLHCSAAANLLAAGPAMAAAAVPI